MDLAKVCLDFLQKNKNELNKARFQNDMALDGNWNLAGEIA